MHVKEKPRASLTSTQTRKRLRKTEEAYRWPEKSEFETYFTELLGPILFITLLHWTGLSVFGMDQSRPRHRPQVSPQILESWVAGIKRQECQRARNGPDRHLGLCLSRGRRGRARREATAKQQAPEQGTKTGKRRQSGRKGCGRDSRRDLGRLWAEKLLSSHC